MSALYDTLGEGYATARATDPRIFARILAALDGCRTVVNVGAGTGSYEPTDRWVLGVEPSEAMIRQRREGAAPCLRGSAEALPLADGAVDAATAFLTVHHWTDADRGLAELRRVARRRVVVLTWLPSFAGALWLAEHYLPEVIAMDADRFPTLERFERALGPITVETVPIPHDCADGFFGAYWRRPASYLDPRVRRGISVLRQLPDAVLDRGLGALAKDLESGAWAERFGALLAEDELDLGYRLLRANVGP